MHPSHLLGATPPNQTSLSSPSPALLLILALMAFEAAENDNLGIYAEEQLSFKDQKQYLKNALTEKKKKKARVFIGFAFSQLN